MTRLRHALYFAAALAACPAAVARAAPYVPQDDGQVLERLPVAAERGGRDLREARRILARDPENLALALEVARGAIGLGRMRADLRWYGLAEGALGPWWHLPDPPPEVRLLRARILAHRHELEGALADLDALVGLEPRNAQAWLARATILYVLARYPEAIGSCAPLVELAEPLDAATCIARSASLNGQAEGSLGLLGEELRATPGVSGEQAAWSWSVLAEIAAALGRDTQAEAAYRQALAAAGEDLYALGSFADFLIERERPAEAVALLAGAPQADSLLVRLAVAKRAAGDAGLDELTQTLKGRFAAARRRGDNLHRRDEARFALKVLGRPQEALVLARENWGLQREPRDAQILLEAALAAGDPVAAQPVLDLLDETGMEHRTLRGLARRIGALR